MAFIIIQLDRITDEYLCLSRQPCFSEEARNIISEINSQDLPVFTNVLETEHEEEWLKMWYNIMLRYYIESPSKLKPINTINNEDIAPNTYFIIVKKVPGNLFSSCNKNRMAFVSYQVRKFIEKKKGAYIYPNLQIVQYLKNKANILYEDETWLIAQEPGFIQNKF